MERQGACVSRDIDNNFGPNHQSALDTLRVDGLVFAAKATETNGIDHKEVITTNLNDGLYAMTKAGDPSLPQLTVEKLETGGFVKIDKQDPRYAKAEEGLQQTDVMLKVLPNCEIKGK